MATLDLPLPTSRTPQVQIEGKSATPRFSRERERKNPLLPEGHKADNLFPSLNKVVTDFHRCMRDNSPSFGFRQTGWHFASRRRDCGFICAV